MPARRDILTGSIGFLWRGWGPLENYGSPLAGELKARDVVTMLITDHVHYIERGGESYHVHYGSNDFVRGNESDRWITGDYNPIPSSIGKYFKNSDPRWLRYQNHAMHFKDESQFCEPTVFRKGISWLEHNYHKRQPASRAESFFSALRILRSP